MAKKFSKTCEDGMGTNKISTTSLHYHTNLNTSSKLRGSFDLYAELQLISNILLDSEFNAKIADFGLAKMLIKQEELATVSAVIGTNYYIAPEYAQTARVNEKTDVYSFGVVLLELTTGKAANYGQKGLAKRALRHVKEGKTIVDALDEEIKEPCYVDEMSYVFLLGVFCTSKEPSARPHMKEVLQILHGRNHPLVYGVKNTGSDYDSTPLLKNSKRERQSESDSTLASDN